MKNLDIYKIHQINYKNILGRNVSDALSSENPLALFWSASGIEVSTNSSELWIEVSSNYSSNEIYLAAQVSGYTISRFMAPKEKTWICVVRNLDSQQNKNISIIKDSQPTPFDPNQIIQIHSIAISKDSQFFEVPKKSCFIEFIGDSITSGEGMLGHPDAQEWISSYISVNNNYAMQVAKRMNAEISIISQCGWGIQRGWDGNIYSNIPDHYENVCSIFNSQMQQELGCCQKYSFEKQPDYIVINLGTNDNFSFKQQPWKDETTGKIYQYEFKNENELAETSKVQVENAIINFLQKIRKHNQNAKILWVWGMLKLDLLPPILLNAIENYKKQTGDSKIYTMELDSMEDVETDFLDRGSRFHPGPKTHLLASKKISDFLQNLN